MMTTSVRAGWAAAAVVAVLGAVVVRAGVDPEPVIQQSSPEASSPWAEFVEPDFPFHSSVLDARALGAGWPADNLTPRGLILNLGNGLWACFDTDLLRVAAIWSGDGVTPVSMSQVSYHRSTVRAPIGQGTLPTIAGTPWIATGLYPGWQRGTEVARVDPRPAPPDPGELGRGPLDSGFGRFTAVRLTSEGVVLEYDAAGAAVEEHIRARQTPGGHTVERLFTIGPHETALTLVVGQRPANAPDFPIAVAGLPASALVRSADGLASVIVPPSPAALRFSVAVGGEAAPIVAEASGTASTTPPVRWPQTVTTQGTLANDSGAFVMDRVAIPTTNPWRRNVRLADIAFPAPDQAALVTFDGDVWTAAGLDGNLERVVWRRFTSGLHEPLGIAARAGRLFVFDRNGIWRLMDADGNGEADRHELVANVFAQTAETREFAMSMRIAPDGAFIIAKGGQVGATRGRDNGSVMRVEADGSGATTLGWGLRQPFASVDPRSGLVISSDQQGNYVPSTPIHIVRDGQYYGFLPDAQPKERYPAPIADPLVWVPHAVSASASGQVWLADARMGPLNDALVLINYYRPELLLVRIDERAARLRAAVATLTSDFDFAPLAGAVNPADGQLYVTGFRIWGTDAEAISGLSRYRYTGAPVTVPREAVATDEGVLLTFDVGLDPAAAGEAANYSAERWNYRRTSAYGSPHFRLDGSRGQDALVPSSAYVSPDRRRVFIGIPDMQPSMQMRVGWSLTTATGDRLDGSVYLTPSVLTAFDSVAEGFGSTAIRVDLTPRPVTASASAPVTVEEGQRIAARMGCVACHSIDGTVTGRVGPSWKGLAGSERELTTGERRTADAEYLRQSILEPTASVARGFDQADAGMPSYSGVLTDAEISALILYIQSLRD